jgi:hypothetical protein
LICTTSSGGKNPGAAGPGNFLKSGESLLEKPLAPLRDDVPVGAELPGDVIVLPASCRKQDHLGPLNLKIRQRIFPGADREFSQFLVR